MHIKMDSKIEISIDNNKIIADDSNIEALGGAPFSSEIFNKPQLEAGQKRTIRTTVPETYWFEQFLTSILG